MSYTELFLGLSLTCFGFIVYYLVPYAIYSSEYGLFFGIFNLVVMGEILVGGTLFFSTIQPYIQINFFRLLILIKRSDARLKPIIINRLESGKIRNQKI